MRELAAEFAARARRAPDALAVIDGTGPHPAGEVMAAADQFAAALDRILDGAPTVLFQADNTWRTLAAALAVGRLDGTIAVISRHITPGELDLAVEDVRPDAVVAAGPVLDSWGASVEAFPERVTTLDGWTLRARGGSTGGVERWAGGRVIAMTSGSTGRSKSVVQSEPALRYAGQCTIDAVGLGRGDAVGALVPLSSVAAFCFGAYLPAMLGGVMVCLDGWKPAEAVRLLREYQARWTMLVPTMALQLSMVDGAEGALSSLRAMTVGGGPMDAGALERAEVALGTKILRVFGMSECLGHTTPSPDDPPEIRLGRDGRPFPGTEVRVVDESGRRLGLGEVGRAQVKGPSLFTGYARYGAPLPRDLTPDGFLSTGDLARRNDDGTITIMGREKQVIIRGGRNIDINEVESAVAAIPTVTQVCVVPVPDELLGERAAALVVSTDPSLTLDRVIAHLEEAGVAKFKWPEFVHVVPELPLNRIGKLSRPDATALARRLSELAK